MLYCFSMAAMNSATTLRRGTHPPKARAQAARTRKRTTRAASGPRPTISRRRLHTSTTLMQRRLVTNTFYFHNGLLHLPNVLMKLVLYDRFLSKN